MTKKRKALSKRQRFEVFKRDSFTCQYCGQSAPDVILNADHIIPVSKGGSNKPINLVTSCFDCNSGKSNKSLDDDSTVKKQMNQLKINQERIEQIEMIAEWAKQQELMTPEIKAINDVMEKCNGKLLSKYGERWIRKLIKKHGFKFIIESIYQSWDVNGDEYIDKLEKFIKYKNSPPEERHWAYSVGILKNRIDYYDKHKSAIMLSKAKDNGLDMNDFRTFVLGCENWDEYKCFLEEYIYG